MLPQLFYSAARPTVVREPHLVAFDRPLATMLGLEPDSLEDLGFQQHCSPLPRVTCVAAMV